jgi:hypothetical protein
MHDSLIDCQAQTDIVTSDQFLPYLNVTHSICLIEDIFTKTKQREMTKGLEPTHPVHEPWEEVDLDIKNIECGALGGGVCGPTNNAHTAGIIGLVALFFFIHPIT